MRFLLFGFVGVCAVLAAVMMYRLAVPAAMVSATISDQNRARKQAVSDPNPNRAGAISDQNPDRKGAGQDAHREQPLPDGRGSARPVIRNTEQHAAEPIRVESTSDAEAVTSTPVRWAGEAQSRARTPLQQAVDQVAAYPDSRVALDAALQLARDPSAGEALPRLLAIGVERFPHELELRFDYGVELMKRRLWSQAITQLRRVAADAPEHPLVWHNLAAAQQGAGHLSDAERSWTRAIELAPNNSDAYAFRGQIRLDLHAWSSALADFEHVLGTEPDAIDAYLGAATALLQLERYADAVARARQGVDLAPDATAVLNQAARIAMEACALGGSSAQAACSAAKRYADQTLEIDADQPEIRLIQTDALLALE